jgi:hypothetical protein
LDLIGTPLSAFGDKEEVENQIDIGGIFYM